MTETDIENGMVVSFMKDGTKSLGEVTVLPSENTDNVYQIQDYLLEEEVSVPQTSIVREIRSGELFRVFVVQKQVNEGWKDVKKFREWSDAESKRKSVGKDTRIISEVLQV